MASTQHKSHKDPSYLAANDVSAALTHSDEVGRLLNAAINGLRRRLTRTSPLTANR